MKDSGDSRLRKLKRDSAEYLHGDPDSREVAAAKARSFWLTEIRDRVAETSGKGAGGKTAAGPQSIRIQAAESGE